MAEKDFKRCILFSDMDGTILKEGKLMEKKDAEMLLELQKAGHLVAFCTGRNEFEAMTAIQKNHLRYDYLILNNGSHIMDRYGKDIYKKTIPHELGMKILEYCRTLQDCYVYFYDSDRCLNLGSLNGTAMEYDGDRYKSLKDCSFTKEADKSGDFDILCVKPLEQGIDYSITRKIAEEIRERFGDQVAATMNESYLDITPKGNSKSSGMKQVVEWAGNDLETYCIGDSFNDLSLFEAVDHSYTFRRCSDQIKAAADHCVDYVYEVAEEILNN